jgi:hypothetical protein
MHVAVAEEVKDLLSRCFREGEFELVQWNLSEHMWTIGKIATSVEIVNAKTWLHISRELAYAFQKVYNEFINEFDLIITGYPGSFLLLFANLEKPILSYNAVRYDLPFCWTRDYESLNFLNQEIFSKSNSGQLRIISNNLADRDYLRLGAGVDSPVIPTLGAYTPIRWQVSRDVSLLYCGETIIKNVENLIDRSRLGRFSFETLGSFSSVVHLPYEVSTMSMYEQYQAGIPLLFPSKEYYSRLCKSTSTLMSRYWLRGQEDIAQFPSSLLPTMSVDWWIDRADFLISFPRATYFESMEHLRELLAQPNHLNQLSEERQIHRESEIVEKWRCLFQKPAPNSQYGEAWQKFAKLLR